MLVHPFHQIAGDVVEPVADRIDGNLSSDSLQSCALGRRGFVATVLAGASGLAAMLLGGEALAQRTRRSRYEEFDREEDEARGEDLQAFRERMEDRDRAAEERRRVREFRSESRTDTSADRDRDAGSDRREPIPQARSRSQRRSARGSGRTRYGSPQRGGDQDERYLDRGSESYFDRDNRGSRFEGITTQALGEEGDYGPPRRSPPTTLALWEEGGRGGPPPGRVTTFAIGEEGSGGSYDRVTTFAIGEEGSFGPPRDRVITTQALGEEG